MEDSRGRASNGTFIYWRDRHVEQAKVRDWCRVVMARSDSAVLGAARSELLLDKPLDRLVVSWDSDADLAHAAPAAGRRASVDQWRAMADISGLATKVTIANAVWWLPAATPTPGLPEKHTLELVVCDALRQVDGARAEAVARFLAEAPVALPVTEKHYAWSYMAKWFGESGCEFFYRSLWQQPSVAAALERTLRASGALDSMHW